MRPFRNRIDAAEKLVKKLEAYSNKPNTLVIGLPRGGVITASIIAKTLHLPLDIVCPRKIGAPTNPEYAIGATTEMGEGFILDNTGFTDAEIEKAFKKEKQEAIRRINFFRENMPPRDLENKCVIIVDDGLATGSTMIAAIKTVDDENASKIIVAVPVAPKDSISKIEQMIEVEQVHTCQLPTPFYSVSQFYETFDEVTDQEVKDIVQTSG